MGFVQIIEFRTTRLDQIRALSDEWEKATTGKRTARRRVLAQDRDNPDRYFNIVFFDSYEEAMENSGLPETDSFSRRMMALGEGPPSFYNLDVIEDRE